MTAAQRWQGRALTVEAAALIVVARTLVALVPFRRWRPLLGQPAPPKRGDAALHRPDNLAARRLARAVERAARRLPGESKCLPKAIALQRMLARRGLGAELVLGVRPEAARGGLDDLHAWVTARGEVVLGGGAQGHVPIYAAALRA